MDEQRRSPPALPRKIISGGQTGVDRAALDVAIRLGIPHGGWCPRGRQAEDGRLPERYRLRETASPAYAARTERNVRDADATLIVAADPLSGGTALTRKLARECGKPCLVVAPDDPGAVAAVRGWLEAERVEVLNVAGPRESQQPGIAATAETLLHAVLAG